MYVGHGRLSMAECTVNVSYQILSHVMKWMGIINDL